ncbi:Protein FAM210A/B-like domain [Dillenia turbinata]|uniref:Protein FAM210A/B-like domain n=1 Tax=Dillenia turbinata TaxID=194707 RepID=A0AAN8USI4_9MAGN
MAFKARMKELLKEYGKVGLVVHCTISTASLAGFYVAIKNNVDVESILEKVGMGAKVQETQQNPQSSSIENQNQNQKKNKTAEMVASSGGAFALALLCNKAVFPIRAPITIALTPPIARHQGVLVHVLAPQVAVGMEDGISYCYTLVPM